MNTSSSSSSLRQEPRDTRGVTFHQPNLSGSASLQSTGSSGKVIIPVTMEGSGYSTSMPLTTMKDIDHQRAEVPHPMVARRVKQRDPVEGENDARGPSKFSTTYAATISSGDGFAVKPIAPKANVGRIEGSGFTRNHQPWFDSPPLMDDEQERAQNGVKLHRWELGGSSKLSNTKNSYKAPPFHVDRSEDYLDRISQSRSRPSSKGTY
eukprot:TRINITY_DN2035_c0_g1_i7.p1 TRINITY_DN2035_c0_g1~~TRINITY_DN2035_c0_g1_i7.p1  ORF type:complete len:208 (+),score=52.72 TRINITY_DN2035_c0_g1_i7:73-696(+)